MSTARRVWLTIHRWVGLSAGLLLVVVGLSGSFLAFYTQIDRALNPDWVTSASHGRAPVSMQTVLDAARTAMPDRFIHSVFPPSDELDVHHVWFTPSAQDQSAMWEVLVDPFTAQVLGSRAAVPTMEFTRRNLANTIYTLHFQLFMGETGATVVGFGGLFLLASGLSGMLLWWPRGGRFRTGLVVKSGSHGIRLHYDLHRVAGVYSVGVLAVVAFTGVILTFPEYARPVVGTFSPLRAAPELESLPVGSGPTVDADAVLQIASRLAPDSSVRCLWLPGASGASWRVTLREAQGVAWAGGLSDVWLHPQGEAVLQARRHGDASSGEVFMAWQLPLHGGSAFGLPGRILVCVLGFVPLLMAVTGSFIWWRKRSARVRSTLVNPHTATRSS